jgi:hypothetical protein
MINTTLGTYLLPNNPTNTLPTIGAMVAAGHRCVVTFQVSVVFGVCAADPHPLCWVAGACERNANTHRSGPPPPPAPAPHWLFSLCSRPPLACSSLFSAPHWLFRICSPLLPGPQYDTVAASTTFLWPGSFILNSYANSDNVTTMMAYNDNEVQQFQSYSNAALYKISWTLTTQASTIEDFFLVRLGMVCVVVCVCARARVCVPPAALACPPMAGAGTGAMGVCGVALCPCSAVHGGSRARVCACACVCARV